MKSNLKKALITLAVAALTALVTGCASDAPATPTPPAPTAPPAAPTSALVGGVPRLAFDKVGVDLGTVARDQQGVATFLVINKGDSPLKVGPVSIHVEQGCDAAATVSGGAEVQPGDLTLLPVRLGPHQELGPHRLLVSVESNDPARPVATLSVDFTVEEEPALEAGPRMRVDKETIDAGIVPYDWPLYEVFTLRNAGDAPLVLEDTPIVRVEEGC